MALQVRCRGKSRAAARHANGSRPPYREPQTDNQKRLRPGLKRAGHRTAECDRLRDGNVQEGTITPPAGPASPSPNGPDRSAPSSRSPAQNENEVEMRGPSAFGVGMRAETTIIPTSMPSRQRNQVKSRGTGGIGDPTKPSHDQRNNKGLYHRRPSETRGTSGSPKRGTSPSV